MKTTHIKVKDSDIFPFLTSILLHVSEVYKVINALFHDRVLDNKYENYKLIDINLILRFYELILEGFLPEACNVIKNGPAKKKLRQIIPKDIMATVLNISKMEPQEIDHVKEIIVLINYEMIKKANEKISDI